MENPPWAAYKKEDGQQKGGFMLFCVRLAEGKTSYIHPEGNHLPPYRHAMMDSMSLRT